MRAGSLLKTGIFLLSLNAAYYFTERYWVAPHRKMDLLESEKKRLITGPARVIREIHDEITASEWNGLFLVKNISRDHLRGVLQKWPDVRSISFTDATGYLYAAAPFEIAPEHINDYIARARSLKYPVQFIEESEWITVLPVFSEMDKYLGALLLSWKFSSLSLDYSMFLSVVDRSEMILSREGYLNEREKSQFITGLLKKEMGDKGFAIAGLEGRNFNIAWSYWRQTGLYLGIVEKRPPVYFSTNALLFFISISGYLIFLLSVHPGWIRDLIGKNTHEKIKRILEVNRMTLEQLSAGVEKVLQPSSTTDLVSRLEKEVAANIVYGAADAAYDSLSNDNFSDLNFDQKDIKKAGSSEEPAVIELQPVVRKFIFLDPMKPLPSVKKHTDDGRLDKIRKSIFNQETVRIFQDISSVASKLEPLLQKFSVLLENHKPDPVLSFLNSIYFDGADTSEISALLEMIKVKTGSNAAAFMWYQVARGSYNIAAQVDMDEKTENNFSFLWSDPVFDLTEGQTKHVIIKSEKMNDPYFRKRFGHRSAEEKFEYEGMLFYPWHNSGLDLWLVLFYKNSELIPGGEESLKGYQALKDLAPALKGWLRPAEAHSAYNQIGEIMRQMKTVSTQMGGKMNILRIHLEKSLNVEMFNVLRIRIKTFLEPTERLIANTPERIIFLLHGSKATDILDIVSNITSIAFHHLESWPADGRSFYIYI